jgi:SagB-type dehydrogenase family enzyme
MSEPAPLPEPRVYEPVAWPVRDRVVLPPPGLLRELPPLDSVLLTRRSARRFGVLSLESLGALFWHVLRTQSSSASQLGFELQRRPVPSAGAIHPIHVMVYSAKWGWAKYCSREHALHMLQSDEHASAQLLALADEVLPRGDASLLAFIAEPGMTAAKYEPSESLVWRDAGVVQGVFAVVAEALNLNFSLLGMNGGAWAQSLDGAGRLMGAGLAWVGSRT